MGNYFIEKSLNNNVLVATYHGDEVILVGKGIGFNKKVGDIIDTDSVEKVYELKTFQDQQRYKTLMDIADDEVIKVVIEVVDKIKDMIEEEVSDTLLLSLTDHIIFAIKRMEDNILISNPFSNETEALYPREYSVASTAVNMLNERLNVYLPESEVGFIALHIHSSISRQSIHDMNLMTEVVAKAVQIIEHDLKIEVDKNSIIYARFVRHISFAVQRVMANDVAPEQRNLENLLKAHYPVCYNVAIKIVKMMQTLLNKPVYESELVYLTMHIQQFNTEALDV
ncbi:transcription antiterminator [Macrococcus hajekii]|uniref:Transcription antiterminator n=1 Tax=Macrococcus hajekii TaxID=198482 RepID=A0A4R6BMK8_9STAP|nr:transcription antiterminator [Macrococcus hajekii]TDM03069.1 transcription antiterminator [Macrococcus hajekii]GGB06313.1 PtsGHI operon antiterminator [Macrococcus hajekii]